MFDAFDAFEDMLEPRPKISSQFEYWLTSTRCPQTLLPNKFKIGIWLLELNKDG